MSAIRIKKLTTDDAELAHSLFAVMASVFGEGAGSTSLEYVASLLSRDDFWALAALADGEPIAGLSAFVLPLTRAKRAELLIYDIAVLPAHQRRGVGRQLVETAVGLATERGIATTWVPAENADAHALEFYRSLGGVPTAATVFTFSR